MSAAWSHEHRDRRRRHRGQRQGHPCQEAGPAFRLRPSGFRGALSPDRASVLEAKGDPKNEADALQGAQTIDFNLAGDPRIRTDIVGKAASEVAAIAAVRQALLDFQQNFLARPPGGSPGAVMDGRDIGTVICPSATAKLYVDARLDVRARRRWAELKAMGIRRAEQDVVAELQSRDAADKSRPDFALKAGPRRRLAGYLRFGYRRGVRGSPRLGFPQGRTARSRTATGAKEARRPSGIPLTFFKIQPPMAPPGKSSSRDAVVGMNDVQEYLNGSRR